MRTNVRQFAIQCKTMNSAERMFSKAYGSDKYYARTSAAANISQLKLKPMKIKPTAKRGQVVVELGRQDDTLLKEGAQAASPFRLKKILVPIDFSDCSKKALQYAVPFAKQFNAALTLLYVVQVNYYVGEVGAVDMAALEKDMRSSGEKQLSRLAAEEVGPGVPCDTLVRSGRIVNEIVDAAKESGTDLILLSTHGHTGLKHILLGSVAENVVRHAPCPVLIVRPKEHEFLKP